MRASKKCLNATFLTDCENLWVFIRSDAHAVRAEIKLKGQPPLNSPGVFDRLILYLSFVKTEIAVRRSVHFLLISI